MSDGQSQPAILETLKKPQNTLIQKILATTWDAIEQFKAIIRTNIQTVLLMRNSTQKTYEQICIWNQRCTENKNMQKHATGYTKKNRAHRHFFANPKTFTQNKLEKPVD